MLNPGKTEALLDDVKTGFIRTAHNRQC